MRIILRGNCSLHARPCGRPRHPNAKPHFGLLLYCTMVDRGGWQTIRCTSYKMLCRADHFRTMADGDKWLTVTKKHFVTSFWTFKGRKDHVERIDASDSDVEKAMARAFVAREPLCNFPLFPLPVRLTWAGGKRETRTTDTVLEVLTPSKR